jgi:hypothetical protein
MIGSYPISRSPFQILLTKTSIMKTTRKEFIEQKHSELFESLGCFFAFSDKQFKEGYEKAKVKKPVKYVSIGAGLLCPKPNVDELIAGMKDIKKQWEKARKEAEKIRLQFVGIDNWNRPVFVVPGKKEYYGDVNNLFSWGATEDEVLNKISTYDLCYFGDHFGCEPMGSDIPDQYFI